MLPGVRTLGQREQSWLLLVDGLSTVSYLSSLIQGECEKLVLHLVKTGYLTEVALAELKNSKNDRAAEMSIHEKSRDRISMLRVGREMLLEVKNSHTIRKPNRAGKESPCCCHMRKCCFSFFPERAKIRLSPGGFSILWSVFCRAACLDCRHSA